MPFVPMRDGRALHVRVVGSGQPVLLLPGLGMNSTHWLPFIAPFTRRYRFHLPDFRGFGRSAHLRIERDDVFESHALDVRDVIAAFDLREFLLGGISLGGTTALHMHRSGGIPGVRRYLHIDQSPCVGNRDGWEHGLFGAKQNEHFDRLRDLANLLSKFGGAKHLADLPDRERKTAAEGFAAVVALIAGKSEPSPWLVRAIGLPRLASGFVPLSNLDDVRVYLAAYLAGGHDYRDSLESFRVPITLMVGMSSPLYPAEGQMTIAHRAPNVHVVRFERSGHVPLVDEPAKFVRELGRFLEGRSPWERGS